MVLSGSSWKLDTESGGGYFGDMHWSFSPEWTGLSISPGGLKRHWSLYTTSGEPGKLTPGEKFVQLLLCGSGNWPAEEQDSWCLGVVLCLRFAGPFGGDRCHRSQILMIRYGAN